MPRDDRVGLDKNKSFGPVIPNAPNDKPEQPVELIQLGPRLSPFVNGELLAKSGGLHCQTVPRYEKALAYASMPNRNVTITLMLLSRFGHILKPLIREVTGVLMTDTGSLLADIRSPVVGARSSIAPSPSTQTATDPELSPSVVGHYRNTHPSFGKVRK